MGIAKIESRAEKLFQRWMQDSTLGPNIQFAHRIPARSAETCPLPDDLHPHLRTKLAGENIQHLYTHQDAAWRAIRQGGSIVVASGTASGKTLCYNLPIIDECYKNSETRALYIFPTKALAQDQLTKLHQWLEVDTELSAAVYDGDTPSAHRSTIRTKANILLTNPDMLHTGILPHHTQWAKFFSNLRYIVIDEMHMYRGVFGSHLANLLRRLHRILAFYGAHPQFILTSATIGNPGELAERLIERPVTVIAQDGSPSGERIFLIYNPPVIDPSLGLRASPIHESQRLLSDLIFYGLQTITFTRTRRSVEILLKYLRDMLPEFRGKIEGYRSGYLPMERREIEYRLRSGDIRAVIATNALELGIDIGSLGASVLIGYPGTIASTRQQSGRAGRKTDTSISVLVAASDPLDQYLVQHPDYLIGRSPELALIDPDNLLILLHHLRCAAFELPFSVGNTFGQVPQPVLKDLLTFLTDSGALHFSNNRYYWVSDQYPAAQVSLRSSSPEAVKLISDQEGKPQVIGTVDQESAPWMVHPNAVYLHSGTSFRVESLDLENHIAKLVLEDGDYYTEPHINTVIEKLSETQSEAHPGGVKTFGDIKVTSQVTGYRQLRWYTRENLGEGLLDLPPSHLITTGYWVSLNNSTVDTLKQNGLWSNDPNKYGPGWEAIKTQVRTRDHFTCQICGSVETSRAHHVHHKIPFRSFMRIEDANHPDNLTTLCPSCHRNVEANVRIRSGLAGLGYVLQHIAPLFLMCDIGDIGVHIDAQSPLANDQPVVVIYDAIPAGIGLAKKLYEIDDFVIAEAKSLVAACPCPDGCPSCVGPGGENGAGGKAETTAILQALVGEF